jgi:hypothetical protein
LITISRLFHTLNTIKYGGGTTLPVSIIFNQINVNSISKSSAVSTGQNNQPDWSTQGKINMGNGIEIGVVGINGVFNVIIDTDGVDTTITNPELNNPQPSAQF